MALFDMKTEDVVLLHRQLFSDTDIIGEKDFFEFIKRLNRELTSKQRFWILSNVIKIVKHREKE